MKTTSPLWRNAYSQSFRFRLLLVCLTALALLFTNGGGSRAQSGSDLKGESAKVNVTPNSTVDAKEIKLKSDRDHDGMPDEDEAANGTNPDDSSDADADSDSDGVTNGDEFSMGTNLNAADSDGDGFSDSDEIQQGFNPLDANSHPAPPAVPGTYQVTRSEGVAIVPGDTDIDNHGDDTATTISLPFDYTLYDQTFSSASISSNGVLQFNGGISDSENSCLPYPYFSYTIVPLWDNLRTDPTGVFTSVTGDAPNRIFNIEWRAELALGGEMHFEVRLYEGQTRFDVIYGNVIDGASSSTIGVQRETGLDFTQYSCGTSAVIAGTQLSFTLVPGAFPTPTPLVITPNPVNIAINSLLGQGQEPVQLHVTRANSDGSVSDLTTAPGTTYESSDSNVALVDDFGSVAGVNSGSALITARNGASTGQVTVTVARFSAGVFGFINIPGSANNVDVFGNHAYVASGATGLTIVTINELSLPRLEIASSLALPGNGNDVRVANNKAYVASGSAGLQIVDVTDPIVPVLLGAVDTPGDAQDVVVVGNRAYVADGEAGLQIIDVTDPSAPAILGSVVTTGTARGVDVSGNLAVVADDQPTSAVRVIDVTDPANPQILGSVPIDFITKDVSVRERLAYVAAEFGGLQVVDFSDPAHPHVINGIPQNGQLSIFARDVKLHGRYVAVAERQYLSQVPVIDLADPTNPQVRGLISAINFGFFSGTGVAIDDKFIYSTEEQAFNFEENAANGNTRLFVTQYQAEAPTSPTDAAASAPTASITSPANGESVLEGSSLTVSADASDDVGVAGVRFSLNGTDLITDTVAPYQITFIVPLNISSLTLGATAFDYAGNTVAASPVVVNVLPDPPPTISIIFPAEGETLTEGQNIFLQADAQDNVSVQLLDFVVNGVDLGPFNSFYTVPFGITSLTVEARATDNLGRSTTATRTVSVVPDPLPTISITSPAAGTQLTEGQTVSIAADAADNIEVSQVVFAINGEDLPANFSSPYTQSITVPPGSTMHLTATVYDNLGQTAVDTRDFVVIPDAGTTVTGFVKDTSAQPIAGATVTAFEITAQTGADGSFSLANVPTVRGNILVRATATIAGQPAANASLPTAPVSGGTINVGTIPLSVGPTAPSAFGVADYDGDFLADVFVGYPDRQSLIYSKDGLHFSPSTTRILPFGAVNSGVNLEFNFNSNRAILAQLSGQPGFVNETGFTSGMMQPSTSLATGLGGESDYIAAGLDVPQAPPSDSVAGDGAARSLSLHTLFSLSGSNPPVLALLKNGSGVTSLTVRFGDDSPEGFADPVVVPVESSVPLRNLALNDINHDGLLDLMVLKPISGTDAKLVVYLRTSASTFGDPIESPVTVRTNVPAHGVDFVIGKFGGSFNQTDIAVFGDDRVRIYQGDGAGGFVSGQELLVPADKIATGITAFDLTRDGRSDVIVTVTDVGNPLSKRALLYLNTFSGTFQAPASVGYTAPTSSGDTRVAVGQWAGGFNRFDLVIVDGDTVILLLDVVPGQGGS